MLLKALTRADNFTLPGPGVMPFTQPLTGPLTVSTATAMSLPVVNRCASVIADTIASLPIGAFRDGEPVEPAPTVLRQIEADRPNVDTVSSMVLSLLIRGNAYALVVRSDSLGFPLDLMLLNPDAVSVQQTPSGQVVYRVNGRTFDSSEILHIRGLTLPGSATGAGVIDWHRRTVGQSIAAEDYSGELWTTGAPVDGYLHTADDLHPDEADDAARKWVDKHGGRQRAIPVLSGGMRFETVSWSNVDLEFLESRKWNAVQVCQMFGVPPIFAQVPSGESKTYQNVQQDSRALAQYTLRPWLCRIEQSLSMLLPRGQTARFDLDELLRADRLERYQAHKVGIDAGFLDPDEVRPLEGLVGPAPQRAAPPPQLTEGPER